MIPDSHACSGPKVIVLKLDLGFQHEEEASSVLIRYASFANKAWSSTKLLRDEVLCLAVLRNGTRENGRGENRNTQRTT